MKLSWAFSGMCSSHGSSILIQTQAKWSKSQCDSSWGPIWVGKKVCAVKDRIYVIGQDMDTEKTNVAEYNARTKGWKILPGASFGPIRKRPKDKNNFSVDFVHGNGNKLYMCWSDRLYSEGEIEYSISPRSSVDSHMLSPKATA